MGFIFMRGEWLTVARQMGGGVNVSRVYCRSGGGKKQNVLHSQTWDSLGIIAPNILE